MSYRAVLFDLDGTLLDTIGDLADSTNAALRRMGHPEQPVERYRYFVGLGVAHLVQSALPEGHRSEEEVARGIRLLGEEYGARCTANTRPYPGVPELLDALVAHDIRLAILSNKPEHYTRLIVEKLLSRWPFAPVVGAREEVPNKPDPAGALEIARELGLPPAAFLYLGASGIDMETAVAAGMFAVGALWGFREAEELKGTGAQALIARPEELLGLL